MTPLKASVENAHHSIIMCQLTLRSLSHNCKARMFTCTMFERTVVRFTSVRRKCYGTFDTTLLVAGALWCCSDAPTWQAPGSCLRTAPVRSHPLPICHFTISHTFIWISYTESKHYYLIFTLLLKLLCN